MKAAVHHRYGEPQDVVGVEDVAMPDLAGDRVLVRVHSAGVNWADASMTTGTPYLMRLGYGLRGPRRTIRGTDLAGTIEVVGADVDGLVPGDSVLGWATGTLAEYVSVPPDQLVPKPSRLTFDQAAAIPMAGCVALQALRDVAAVSPGDHVLVNGASGGIGSFAVQLAKAMGAEVTGVCSTRNVDLVRWLGADHVVDYTEADFTEGDVTYDVILDMADNRTLGERRRVLSAHGTLIPNSGSGGRWFGSLGRIAKAWIVSPFVGQKLRPFLSLASRDDLLELSHRIERGEVTPFVGTTYSLADAGAAIEVAGSGHGRGNVVVVIEEEAG